MTHFQLNQKKDEAGTSQILCSKPFQRQFIRKLLVMCHILLFLLYPFYFSSFLISFSIFMSSFFILYFLFPVSSVLFIMLFFLLSFLSFSVSILFLAPNSFVHYPFPSPIYYLSQSTPLPILIFYITLIPLVLFWRAQLSVRGLKGITPIKSDRMSQNSALNHLAGDLGFES
jgi:hypothetical protein